MSAILPHREIILRRPDRLERGRPQGRRRLHVDRNLQVEQANKLSRTYATLLDALKRHRGKVLIGSRIAIRFALGKFHFANINSLAFADLHLPSSTVNPSRYRKLIVA
jgi:hypothetical protein